MRCSKSRGVPNGNLTSGDFGNLAKTELKKERISDQSSRENDSDLRLQVIRLKKVIFQTI